PGRGQPPRRHPRVPRHRPAPRRAPPHLIGVITRHDLPEGPGPARHRTRHRHRPRRAHHHRPGHLHRQIAAAAPTNLQHRQPELAALTEFSAGPGQYLRIEADYRAGKTALAAWYATHPPAGLETTTFLITRRQAGQADTDAFLTAVTDQLGYLAPTLAGAAPNRPGRLGHFWQLLDTAAERLEQNSTDPEWQADALTGIAAAIMRVRGIRERAADQILSRVLVSSLTGPYWLSAVPRVKPQGTQEPLDQLACPSRRGQRW
ncbi:hypothetical protein, partial [Intrasporangium sp.]|uniref:hypothetical protein n=1 Tax=Intrasporangium sp. TaxID=1925024 RepID=UPI00322173BB